MGPVRVFLAEQREENVLKFTRIEEGVDICLAILNNYGVIEGIHSVRGYNGFPARDTMGHRVISSQLGPPSATQVRQSLNIIGDADLVQHAIASSTRTLANIPENAIETTAPVVPDEDEAEM